MKIFLRGIAVLLGVTALSEALVVIRVVANGELTTLVRSGALGVLTLAGWVIVLAVATVAAMQLWSLRRIGLVLSAVLCGVACTYYAVGLFSEGTERTLKANPDGYFSECRASRRTPISKSAAAVFVRGAGTNHSVENVWSAARLQEF